MKWWFVLALVACKRHDDGRGNPLAKHDAAVVAGDATDLAGDAEVAKAKLAPTKVIVGDQTSCAIMSDTTLRCWGKNSDGQLGDGTTKDAATPVMPALHGVKDVVLGAAHACALLDDSSVTCWGRINFGKGASLLKPTGPPGVARASRIFAVGGASCATIASGALVCWGDVDIKGHVRHAGEPEHRLPTPARGLDHVIALAPTGALREDGTVALASGEPTGLSGVTEIAAAGDAICGLRNDGSVACAGPTRICGSAKTTPTPKPKPKPAKGKRTKPTKAAMKTKALAKPEPPIEVLQLPPAKHLAFDAGLCALTSAGKLQCLASSGCGVDAPWLANVEEVSGTCARLKDGSAHCWSAKSHTARAIAGVTGATAIATSASHACALLANHTVACWGSNKHGALGRSKMDDPSLPGASAAAL